MKPEHAAFLRLVRPVIDRIAVAVSNETAAVAAYALLALAVVEWQKTGLTDQHWIELVERLARNGRQIRSPEPGGAPPAAGGLN